jgi:hypothetical protein
MVASLDESGTPLIISSFVTQTILTLQQGCFQGISWTKIMILLVFK